MVYIESQLRNTLDNGENHQEVIVTRDGARKR